MAAPTSMGVLPQAPNPGISHRGKQWFYCNSSLFTNKMFLNPTLRATGGEFWEHKGQQGSVVLFLCQRHSCLTVDSGRSPHSVSHLLAQSLFSPLALLGCTPQFSVTPGQPKETPAPIRLLPSPSCAASSWIQGCT